MPCDLGSKEPELAALVNTEATSAQALPWDPEVTHLRAYDKAPFSFVPEPLGASHAGYRHPL